MGGGKHIVFAAVYHCRFADGITAPEEEYEPLSLLRERTDGGIGELLPPVVLVRAGGMGAHRERGVEQQHPLVCPTAEVSTGGGDGKTEVVVYLLDDIDQRWRHTHTVGDREAQSLRLPRLVVGVLPKDDDFHLVERRAVEGGKDKTARGIAGVRLALLDEECLEVCKIVGLKLRPQHFEP